MEARIEDMGGSAAYLERIASGESITRIAESFGVSRSFFLFWLHRTEERWDAYQAARVRRPAFLRLPPVSRAIIKYGGAQKVLDELANGKTLLTLGKEIGIGRTSLSNWLKDPRRLDLYKEAEREFAGALADQALEIVDNADVSDKDTASANVRKAEIQATQRKWRAGIADRATYGTEKDGNTNISIAALHLNALLKLGGPRKETGTPVVPQLEGAIISLADVEAE